MTEYASCSAAEHSILTDLSESSDKIVQHEIGFHPSANASKYRWTKLLLKAAILSRKFILRDLVTTTQSSADLRAAEELLYTEYLSRDLCGVKVSKRHYSAFSFLPTTTTLISRRQSKIVGTISIIEDGALGLPIDLLYKEELDTFRSRGLELVELGAFALNSVRFRRKAYAMKSPNKLLAMAGVFTGAINHIYQYSDATHLVIMVNPKHTEIYRFLGMEQFSDVRHYPRVNKPAVPMILDIERFFNSAHEHVPALFATSCMKVLHRKRRYQASALDLVERISMDALYFAELSDHERATLTSTHPLAQSAMELVDKLALADQLEAAPDEENNNKVERLETYHSATL